MTQDEIIRMARDVGAGFPESLYGRTDYVVMTQSDLHRFAQLVAAHEQERCALVCVTLGEYYAECDDFEAEDVALACASSIRESEK